MLPLLHPGCSSAPWSPSSCTRLLSPIAFFPLLGFASTEPAAALLSDDLRHLPVASLSPRGADSDLSHSLAFDSLLPCEASYVLWFARYPDRFRSGQNPLAAYRLRQAPTNHRGASLPKPLSGRSGPAGFSTTFCLIFRPGEAFPTRSASPSRAS